MTPIVQYAVGAVGVLFAWILFSSPYTAVHKAKEEGSLGQLNSHPIVVSYAQCCMWLVYTMCLNDVCMLLANLGGAMITLDMIIICSQIGTEQQRRDLLYLSVASTFLTWTMGFLVLPPGALLHENGKEIVGWLAVGLSLVMFASPLSTIIEVIKTKDASSIYLPLTFASILCAGLWASYGLMLNEWPIAGPNIFGLLSSFTQLSLRCCYPALEEDSINEVSTEEMTASAGKIKSGQDMQDVQITTATVELGDRDVCVAMPSGTTASAILVVNPSPQLVSQPNDSVNVPPMEPMEFQLECQDGTNGNPTGMPR